LRSAPLAELPVDVGLRERLAVIDVPEVQKEQDAPPGQNPARPEVPGTCRRPDDYQERIDYGVGEKVAV
jgi:hypothetical protein